MHLPETEQDRSLGARLRRFATEGREGDLIGALAEAWRRNAAAASAVVLGRPDGASWEVVAATPGSPAYAAESIAELAALATADEVTAIPGDSPAGHGVAAGVTLDGGKEYRLVAVGAAAPAGEDCLSDARALAAVGSLALECQAARVGVQSERARALKLVSAGIVLSAELDLDEVLQRLVDTTREVLGARYAALGVLDATNVRLDNFVTSGLSEEEHAAIGALPTGRGLLGLLIREPRPIRVAAIADDPRSSGFPPNHPAMVSFLGVPIRVGTKVFGNLYVTDKLTGPFTDEDELVALTLAAQAAVAIGNARRYREQEMNAMTALRERERATADGLRRAIEAQEAERARIARELHDEAGQELTALALQLRAMDDHVRDEPGRAYLSTVRQALARTSTNLRALAIELRPSGLAEHGLASAIERQAVRLQDSSGIAIDVAIGTIPNDLGEAIEIALFRVVQEALTNVVRHSGANRASVVASVRGGRLRVVIEDDGRGFDPEARTDRLGLAGIRERIQLIGGGLRIESAPGAGTTVIIDLEVPDG